MHLQFIGCGDAFGSGGRFNTCLHLVGATTNVLIDCGASSLPALKRSGIERNAINAILITHFHADHFGGVPFFLLDAHHVSRRERALTIVGPPGLEAWLMRAMEAAFPGALANSWRFSLALHEVALERTDQIGPLQATPYHVIHDDRAGPCLAYRIAVEGRIVAYSGDTEWTEALLAVGRDADVFVCECYRRDHPVRAHLSLADLARELPRIGAKRVILTHMGEEMLSRLDTVPYETAADGLTIEF
jgi:ribonuclease BN (tRNA processing enzyme)